MWIQTLIRENIQQRKSYQRISEIAEIAETGWREISETGDLGSDTLGKLMRRSWEIKKEGLKDANPVKEEHEKLMEEMGAIGWKLCGAGGGGFIGVFVEGTNIKEMTEIFKPLTVLKPGLDSEGLVLYDITRQRRVNISDG